MHPVDVYAEWIDACESKAQETRARDAPPIGSRPRAQPVGASAHSGLAPGENFTQEDRNFIDDDEADAEAEFEDEE